MIADLYFPETGHPMMVNELDPMLNSMFRELGHNANAKWFFEDDESVFEFTVYGVRVSANGMSDPVWDGLLTAIETYCLEHYEDVEVIEETA